MCILPDHRSQRHLLGFAVTFGGTLSSTTRALALAADPAAPRLVVAGRDAVVVLTARAITAAARRVRVERHDEVADDAYTIADLHGDTVRSVYTASMLRPRSSG